MRRCWWSHDNKLCNMTCNWDASPYKSDIQLNRSRFGIHSDIGGRHFFFLVLFLGVCGFAIINRERGFPSLHWTFLHIKCGVEHGTSWYCDYSTLYLAVGLAEKHDLILLLSLTSIRQVRCVRYCLQCRNENVRTREQNDANYAHYLSHKRQLWCVASTVGINSQGDHQM